MKEQLIKYWLDSGIIKDKKLIEAFKKTPRELFIHNHQLKEAYGDYPLPIGHEQTISQPTTVMIMIEALELKKTDKVLEIGTGSGWCAAIISRLCKKIITTERIPELAEFAKKNIDKLKIKNIEVVNTDGSKGYEKEAPYDKIIVTAASPKIPSPLIEQLKENGIIVAPVGSIYGQEMVKGKKIRNKITTTSLGSFMFVPLKGEHGY